MYIDSGLSLLRLADLRDDSAAGSRRGPPQYPGPGRLPPRKPGVSPLLDGPRAAGLLRRPVAAFPAGTGGRIPRLLDEVGLNDRAGEAVAAYSKGMLQRLALAQALVNDPELLVLDEPTEGMDLSARKLLHEIIFRRKAEGKTAILVSHSMADVGRLCDELAVLRGGQVVFQGSLADLTGEGPRRGRCRFVTGRP